MAAVKPPCWYGHSFSGLIIGSAILWEENQHLEQLTIFAGCRSPDSHIMLTIATPAHHRNHLVRFVGL